MEIVKFLLISLLVTVEGIQLRNDDKIQGGENVTDIVRFPFIGHFEASHGDKFRLCTGILVDQLSAITAGHCVLVDTSNKPYKLLPLNIYEPFIVFGSANPYKISDSFYQNRNISKLYIHPRAEYEVDRPILDRYDIGAMKWTKKLILNKKIQLVPMIPEGVDPEKVILEVIIQNSLKVEQCELPGWGALEVHWSAPTTDLRIPETLQVAKFGIVSKHSCCLTYFPKMYVRCVRALGVAVSGFLCYIRHILNTSMALGDSGSPLYCPYKGKKYVIGMNVAGAHAVDPPPNGTVEVFNPSYFIIDAVMRPYIKNITETVPDPLINRSGKRNDRLFLIEIFAALYHLRISSSL